MSLAVNLHLLDRPSDGDDVKNCRRWLRILFDDRPLVD